MGKDTAHAHERQNLPLPTNFRRSVAQVECLELKLGFAHEQKAVTLFVGKDLPTKHDVRQKTPDLEPFVSKGKTCLAQEFPKVDGSNWPLPTNAIGLF